MIVKNAQPRARRCPKVTLPAAVIRVTHIANGVSGYVSKSNTSFSRLRPDGRDLDPGPGQQLRVDGAATRDVLRREGARATARAVSTSPRSTSTCTAKMNADIGERDSLLTLLANANNLGDILTLRDRITSVQADIDQMQGQLNVLSNQSTYSAISVLLARASRPRRRSPRRRTTSSPPTGLQKSWNDARQGFANSRRVVHRPLGGRAHRLAHRVAAGLRAALPLPGRAPGAAVTRGGRRAVTPSRYAAGVTPMGSSGEPG